MFGVREVHVITGWGVSRKPLPLCVGSLQRLGEATFCNAVLALSDSVPGVLPASGYFV